MKTTLLLAAAALAMTSAAANATTIYSTFEDVTVPYGSYETVSTADGWTSTNGIEIQNHAAGAPASNGGMNFVELDTYENSSMSQTLTAGKYNLNFLYSPRPGVPATSDGIEVLLNGTPVYNVAVDGSALSDTAWRSEGATFTATPGSTLTFEAVGTSDSVGGYIDNISVSAVPEPGVWAMMLAGVAMMGAALRFNRRRAGLALA